MAWAEETIKRGRKVKHFFDPDTGLHKAEFTIHDRHYHDGAVWQDVDESLVDDGLDGYDKKCDKTQHIFRVGTGGQRRWYPRRNILTEYVAITNIQYWRTQGQGSWANINLPAAVWKSNGAEWDMANLYASITNTWKHIKAEFILKDVTAPTRLRFAITLVGLTLGADWKLTSIAESVVVGSIDPPTAFDANEASVPVTAVYAGGYIEWEVVTAGAVYPISVDPTFTDGFGGDVTTSKDVSILNQSATNNFGVDEDLVVRNDSGSWEDKSLLEFDLSSIPGGSTCNSATLYLYRNNLGEAATRTITIYSIASGNASWIEGTKNDGLAGAGEPCWNALAADGSGGVTTPWAGSAGLETSGTDFESSALGSFSSVGNAAVGTEYSTTLTASRIEDWFGGDTNNYGILMLTNDNTTGFHYFGSSDHATTGYRPKLVVVYTEAGGDKIPFPILKPVQQERFRQLAYLGV
jgi:hypothetical protein